VSELGDILLTARHKKNVGLDEVAEATRIKREYLEALEHGDYNALPGPAYVTGFLRNYARYLGLHPDDVVQEYFEAHPPPQPGVKAATRVLANGHRRQYRTRVFWGLSLLVLLLAGGYAIKQYNDAYTHSYAAPLVTPANLGAPDSAVVHRAAPKTIQLQLRAVAPAWIRVMADGKRVYQGIMRPRSPAILWTAHHAIFVFTYEPARIQVIYDGRAMGRMARAPGLTVDEATPSAWRQIS
jgi:transcriptional regulator with XRE-family HTH domain